MLINNCINNNQHCLIVQSTLAHKYKFVFVYNHISIFPNLDILFIGHISSVR